MSSLAMTNALASVFVPIGIAGSVLAIVCAIVGGFALARGAAGLFGGSVGIWIVGALLSLAASFANDWTPLIVSGIALGVALVVGALARTMFTAVLRIRAPHARHAARPSDAMATAPAQAQAVPVSTGSVATATA